MVKGCPCEPLIQRGQNTALALADGQMKGISSLEGDVSQTQSRGCFEIGVFELQHLQPLLTQRLEALAACHQLIAADHAAAAFQGECRGELGVHPSGDQPGACLLLQEVTVRRCSVPCS